MKHGRPSAQVPDSAMDKNVYCAALLIADR
jgi:hypothetical protein